jgi:hypothetical protein
LGSAAQDHLERQADAAEPAPLRVIAAVAFRTWQARIAMTTSSREKK